MFRFRTVKFETDEGTGEDEIASAILDRKFGSSTLTVRARSSDQAFREAVRNLEQDSGFEVKETEYDLIIT